MKAGSPGGGPEMGSSACFRRRVRSLPAAAGAFVVDPLHHAVQPPSTVIDVPVNVCGKESGDRSQKLYHQADLRLFDSVSHHGESSTCLLTPGFSYVFCDVT